MKKLFFNKAAFAALALISILFFACKKDAQTDNLMQKIHKSGSSMRTFSSMDELFEEVKRLMPMDEQEIENYENSIGFCSFGRMTNSIYYPIVEPIVENELEFDVDQAREYVIQYPEYLELITDENGEYAFVQKYRCELFRYIMNEDRLFQVGENVYKVFKEAIISTPIEKVGNLSAITEENIERIIREIDKEEYSEIDVFSSRIAKSTADGDDTTGGKSRLVGATQISGESRLVGATIVGPTGGPTPGPCGRKYGTHGRYYIYKESPVASNNQEKVIGKFYCDTYPYSTTEFQCIATVQIYAQWRGKCKGCVWVGTWRTLNMDFNMEIFHGDSRFFIHHKYTTSKAIYNYAESIFDARAAYNPGKVFRSSIYNLCGRFWIATTERTFDE